MQVEEHDTQEQLRQLARGQREVRQYRRVRAVLLARQGHTARQIAAQLEVSRRAVQQWVHRYNKDGRGGLVEARRSGRRPRLRPEQRQLLVEKLSRPPDPGCGFSRWGAPEIRRMLWTEMNVLMSLRAVQLQLQRMGYSYLMPRPQHHKANPAAQAAFKANLPGLLRNIASQHPGKSLSVWYEDEARLGQSTTLSRVWARRNTRPRVARQMGRRYVHVLGALCPATGAALGLVSQHLDLTVISRFLDQLSQRLGPQQHGVLVWDGAGYHVSKKLQLPANLTLVSLPPYSPELNPVENLWHYLRSHCWSNRTYADVADLAQSGRQACRMVEQNPQLVRSVGAVPYLCTCAGT